ANHGDRFISLLDEHMPDWQHRKQMLGEMPLHFG
ncbi:M48 family metallopeptidase, partial [Acinetobacter nosocomialis]|nr:M48 family metallopeptidase [Acinetobacter nosocomialis]